MIALYFIVFFIILLSVKTIDRKLEADFQARVGPVYPGKVGFLFLLSQVSFSIRKKQPLFQNIDRMIFLLFMVATVLFFHLWMPYFSDFWDASMSQTILVQVFFWFLFLWLEFVYCVQAAAPAQKEYLYTESVSRLFFSASLFLSCAFVFIGTGDLDWTVFLQKEWEPLYSVYFLKSVFLIQMILSFVFFEPTQRKKNLMKQSGTVFEYYSWSALFYFAQASILGFWLSLLFSLGQDKIDLLFYFLLLFTFLIGFKLLKNLLGRNKEENNLSYLFQIYLPIQVTVLLGCLWTW